MLRRILPAVTVMVAALGMATPAGAVEGMPAADGEPMLWPVATQQDGTVSGMPARVTRYGFLDVSGKLAVPADYNSYSYCADAEGRPVAVVATGEKGSDLIELDGKVSASVDSPYASCAGKDYLIIAVPEHGRWQTGVVEAATGRRVLTPAARQQVQLVAAGTVNVSRADGEYFLDLVTGVRTRHPGWVTVAGQEVGAPGVPAAAQRTSAGRVTGKLGYLGRSGEWLVLPQFDAASAFRGGYAVVEQNGRATFLDAGLRRVGGEWDRIQPITVAASVGERVLGYWVEADGRRGLLGPDLETVVQPGPSEIDCDPSAEGTCAVVAPDGEADLVQLPQGVVTAMPAGFTRALNAGLVADQPSAIRAEPTRIQSLDTGLTYTLPGQAACRGVGQLFVSCSGSLVIDTDGKATDFTSVVSVPDPAGGTAYYWVTTAHDQGYLDLDGRWRYRESR